MSEHQLEADLEKSLSSSLSGSSITLPTQAHMSESEKAGQDDLHLTPTSSDEQAQHQQNGDQIRQYRTALDWEGPEDPENAENWSRKKKAYHIIVVALQCFTITFGSSVYTPSVPLVAEHFHVSSEAALLPLTLYVLGLAFGPVISAPLSETFGRRIIYLALFPIFLLFTLGAGLAQNFGTLLVCRFLAAMFGSGCLAVGAGTNSDVNPPLKRAAVSSLFLLAPFAGPALGPPIGGYVGQFETWRWSQWTILMIGAFTAVFGLFQKETYKKIILNQRAKRLNLPPPPNPMAAMSAAARLKFILTITIFRPVVMVFTEPIVAFLGIYTAFNFAVLFAFFAAFPLVYSSIYADIQIYHFSRGEGGLVFLAIGVGLLIASLTFLGIDRYVYFPKALKKVAAGADPRSLLLPPEERVYAAMVGSFMLPVGLFWFAWTARADIHWIVPTLACIPFGAGNILVFFTAVMYQIDAYGALGGASAMAANGILRYTLGAVFPLFTTQMYRALGVGWATSLLGFVTVALMPVPWILYKYGDKIRARSKYT